MNSSRRGRATGLTDRRSERDALGGLVEAVRAVFAAMGMEAFAKLGIGSRRELPAAPAQLSQVSPSA